MIIVIADDMTGAAEIAGVAHRYGLQVRLLSLEEAACNNPCFPDDHASGDDVLVYATNTRSGSRDAAVSMMRRIVGRHQGEHITFFKKTDSVMRGHIMAEIQTLMDELCMTRSLLIAQNPSKGRIVHQGIYSIHVTPLSETPFRDDPEFPAYTSNAVELLGGGHILTIDAAIHDGINIADARNEEEIEIQLSKAQEDTLLAGGADCFNSVLQRISFSTLVICGSTQSKPLQINIPCMAIPLQVFHGGAAHVWQQQVLNEYRNKPSLILTVGHPDEINKDYSERLKQILAETAGILIKERCPQRLIIEGGATAFAVFKTLQWDHFQVTREISPGIVQLSYLHEENGKAQSVSIILKPGSYPWDGLF